RDLQLAELRMSVEFAPLTEQYRQTISDYLGQSAPRQIIMRKNFSSAPISSGLKKTLKRLDELDAQRRELEVRLDKSGSDKMPALTGRESNL
ncbi:MAG TPA: hypothetical protein VN516_05535, partial [Candidatus Baltobacteraceae bacterium]|nr:hypothetical protein [Candidatus Baltobacteraceae bacterium]